MTGPNSSEPAMQRRVFIAEGSYRNNGFGMLVNSGDDRQDELAKEWIGKWDKNDS